MIEDDHARLRKVEIGIRGTGFVEVVNGPARRTGRLARHHQHQERIARSAGAERAGAAMNLILTIAWTHVRYRAVRRWWRSWAS